MVIVGTGADNALDAHRLELCGVGDKAWQVRGVAGRGEGAGHGKQHHEPFAERGDGIGVDHAGGIDQLDGN